MAHTLKLNIYTLELKKSGSRTLLTWNEFFKQVFGSSTKEDEFVSFKTSLLSYFGNSFTTNKSETKAVSLKNIDIDARKNTFNGTFNGGLTGINQEIYNNRDSKKVKDTVGYDDIASLTYYFKLWTPYDSNIGILMLQSYASLGCNAEISDLLKLYFKNKGYTLSLARFVPKPFVEHFKNTSNIYQISFERKDLSEKTKHGLSPIYDEIPRINAKLVFSGFKVSPATIWDKLKDSSAKLLEADLTMLEMANTDEYQTIVSYEDSDGHKSNLNICKSDMELKIGRAHV